MDDNEFYTPEAVSDIALDVFRMEEVVKYLFNLPLNHEDSKLRTPEMMEEFEHLADNCESYLKAYKYYLKAENYLCADIDEMEKHIKEYYKALKAP